MSLHQSSKDSSADETTAMTGAGSREVPNYASTSTTESMSRKRDKHSGRDTPEPEKRGWFWRLRAVELENEGSTARDHLALERTFLAWLRTSLAFASIGVGISQLFRLNAAVQSSDLSEGIITLRHLGKPLGITFLATAIAVLLIGVHRYFESQGWLLRGKFPASRGSVYFLTGIVALLITVTLVVVLIVQPSNAEK
ncbi:uncharacterized protein H6S33_004019 [Morchella sextelata]|uniref:uncharacterized protein n=1 Tax=Morchella sextelata TaxID=1174677 RepID=UPI001D0462B1|nr:uncharacterized protein H6S33_004019 [Morchella sextelata]KAH0606358.1 hypothetical protein H6S33_004019 [Morchella sextelata]